MKCAENIKQVIEKKKNKKIISAFAEIWTDEASWIVEGNVPKRTASYSGPFSGHFFCELDYFFIGTLPRKHHLFNKIASQLSALVR